MTDAEMVQHTAFLREAQLAAALESDGLACLGKANHAQVSYYHRAFFGLSIGLERHCKLLFMADHAIRTGMFPTIDDLRDQGHDLASLLTVCENIGTRVDQSREFAERPSTPIHRAAVEVLTAFAKSTRYYNLDILTRPSMQTRDPVAAWWSQVGNLICEQHYSAKQRARDDAEAHFVTALWQSSSVVAHTAETGEAIRDMQSFMKQGQAARIVQRFGPFYVAQVVRWLTSIGLELSHAACTRMPAIAYFHEPFTVFYNDDSLLKRQRSWRLVY